MSVEFNEDQNAFAQRSTTQFQSQSNIPSTFLSKIIIKTGLASDNDSASKVLAVIGILSFLTTLFVIFKYIL